jgi:hypothetical protein
MDETPGASTTNNSGFLMIDRGRTASGLANATSAVISYSNGTSWAMRLYSPVAFPGQLPSQNFGPYIGWPWSPFSEASGGVLPAFPFTYIDPAPQILLIPLSINSADFGPFQTFQATHLGAVHTFMAFPNTDPYTGIGYANITAYGVAGLGTSMNHRIALLYE